MVVNKITVASFRSLFLFSGLLKFWEITTKSHSSIFHTFDQYNELELEEH
jgi:hypothetical protein